MRENKALSAPRCHWCDRIRHFRLRGATGAAIQGYFDGPARLVRQNKALSAPGRAQRAPGRSRALLGAPGRSRAFPGVPGDVLCKPFLANPFLQTLLQTLLFNFMTFFFFFAEGCRQDAPKTPQEAPRRPQDAQNPPKMEPSWHQNRFKNQSYLKNCEKLKTIVKPMNCNDF